MNPPAFEQRASEVEGDFATHPLIRAVNFHSTAHVNADEYEKQLTEYAKHFSSVNVAELDEYLETGRWHKPKPGLIISVFEGYRNSYEVLVPLLEKHGFIGWFWMITTFINTPVAEQLSFADQHEIEMRTHEFSDGHYALTWEQLREIEHRGHVVMSHSQTHRFLADLPPDVQRQEVIGSQQDFIKNLGHPVRGFVSLLGPAYGEFPQIDKLIEEAGYDLVLSNYRVQRIPKKQA